MNRIDNSSAVANRPVPGPPGASGYFTDGNPAAAQEATIVDAWWANSIQEEILTVIEQAGIVPDKSSVSQLYEALNKLYLGAEDIGDIYLTIATYREWEKQVLTGGSPSSYTVTYNIAPTALADGMAHQLEFHIANAAQATLNVNALGPKPIHYYSVGAWRPIPPNLIGPNQYNKVNYHAGTDAYRLSEWKDTTGDYIPTGRNAARLGTSLGMGQAVDRVQYAGLYAAYGITYGQGNGSTTFNLPDLRGRTVAGTDLGAGRLSAQIAGTLGSVGGMEQVQYTVTGTAASQNVGGNAYVAGTAYTNGLGTLSSGGTDDDQANWVFVSGNTIQAAIHPHRHTISALWGAVQGNASVDASGYITGWTGGGGISGSTDMRTNLPPTIVASYAIAL
jgi:microcystin-dependent protein